MGGAWAGRGQNFLLRRALGRGIVAPVIRLLARVPAAAFPGGVLLAAVAAVACGWAAGASPALAANTRYASWDGSGTACSAVAPCALRNAAEAAEDGDVVTLLYAAGHDYEFCSSCYGLRIEHEITVRGEPGKPPPTIRAGASGFWPAVVQILSPGVVVEGIRIEASDRQALVASTTGLSNGGTPPPGPVDGVTLREIDIEASEPGSGPAVSTEGSDTLERVNVFRRGSSRGDALWVSEGGLVRDGFITRNQEGEGSGMRVFGSGGVPVRLRNLTVFGTVDGIFALEGPFELSVRNAIVDGENDDIATASTADVTANVTYSNLDPSAISDNPPESVVNLIAPIQDQRVEPPHLVNPFSYDFHEVAGSPTVDAGSPDPFTDSLDVDGEARVMGAAIDIGADELHDGEAPDTTIDSGLAEGAVIAADAVPSFSFSSPAADLAGFECSLDGAAFSACTSPCGTGPLAAGAHGFAVRARDTTGNVDPTPAARRWFVVTSIPTPTPTPTPPAGGSTGGGATTGGGSTATGGDATSAAAGRVRIRLARGPLVVRRHRLLVRLTCPRSEARPPCAGRLVLRTAAKLHLGRHKRHLLLGKTRISLGAGVTRRLALRLPRHRERVLRQVHRARRVRLFLAVHDAAGRRERIAPRRGLRFR